MQRNQTRPVFSMAAMVGECVDDCHPEWCDHFMIVYADTKGESFRQWLPGLLGLEIRRGDLVLIAKPINWATPVITGILPATPSSSSSAFSPWKLKSTTSEHESPVPEPQKLPRSSFEVRTNNTVALTGETPIQVVTHSGRKLVEIGLGANGPTIRICERDAVIDLPGKLAIIAGELELKSRSGDLKIEADHDVVVQGDLIRLN
ncbi:MAG: hypothetical protein FWH27_14335 [Planctomycetaceae bacterium]|nr:hypothetical protein [Planctomycetaceae bacterium]